MAESTGNGNEDRNQQLADVRKKKSRHRDYSNASLNTRFLVFSTVFAALTGGVVYTLHGYQSDRLTTDLLALAENTADDDPKQAQQWYRDYLQFRSDDVDARIRLGELQMQTADSYAERLEAFRTNEEILRTHAGLTDVRRRQVDLSFKLGRFPEASEHLQKLIDQENEHGDLHMLLGLAFEAERRFEEAIQEFNLAIGDDEFTSVEIDGEPRTKFEAYARRARILRDELNQPAAADRVYRELLKKHPDSAEAYLLRAGYHSQDGLLKFAAADARKAVELDPNNADALVTAASLTLRDPESTQKQFKTMHESLTAAVSSEPEETRFYTLLAQFESRLGNTEQAISTLEQGVNQTTENQNLSSQLIAFLISEGRLADARAALEKVPETDRSTDNRNSLFLEGSILLREGQFAAAAQQLQQAREAAITDSRFYRDVSIQLGECWLAMGRPHDALAEFNAILQDDPKLLQARTGLARALAASGNPVEAVRIRRNLPLDSLAAALELARLELQIVLTQLPEERNWNRVEAALAKADGFDSESSDVSLIRAMMLTAKGNRAEAQQILQAAAGRQPINVDVIGALAQLALGAGDTRQAAGLLEDAAALVDNDPGLDRYRLVVWKQTNPQRFASALQEFAAKEYPSDSADRVRLLESIAAWHVAAGDRNRALDVLFTAAELRVDHVHGWLQLLGSALQLNRDDVKDRAWKELQRLTNERDVHRRCALAMIRINESRSDTDSPYRSEARRLLLQVVQERNDWPQPYLLLGQLDLSAGKREEAAEWYRLAVLHGSRDPAVLRLTSRLLVDQRRPQEAIELFEQIRASARGQLRSTMTQLMGQVFSTQGRRSEFFQLIQGDADSGNAGSTDRFLRGQMLYMSGDYEAAEAELRAAVKEDPTEANGWLSLASFLVRRGDRTAAAEVVDQAAAALGEAGKPIALAHCLELVGRTDDAEAQLKQVVDAEPDNAAARFALASFYVRTKRWKQASELIDPMLKSPEKFSGINLLAVRRLKAVGIAFTSFAGYREALALLQTNINEAVDRSTDQRIRARLLLRHAHPDFVTEGLGLFSVVEQKVNLNVQERLLAARACDRLEQTRKAHDHWQALLTDHPRDPRVISSWVRRQLRRGDLEGLRELVERLQQLGNPLISVELATRLDFREGRISEAAERIDQYIADAEDDDSEDTDEMTKRMKQSARLLAEMATAPQLSEDAALAAFNRSDALYRELSATDGRLMLPHAQLLARHGDLQQALDLLQRTDSDIPELLRAAQASQSIQHVPHDDPQVERVQRWVTRLRKRDPVSLQLVYLDASICLRRQQYDKAIELHGLVLKQNPKQVSALNNLAWILGTQKGDYQQAFDLLKTAIEVAGPAAYLIDTRGFVSLQAGRLDAAIDDFTTASKMDNQPATRFHLALALSRNGDIETAREHLQQALTAGLKPHMLEGSEVSVFRKLRSQLGLTEVAAR